MTLLRAAACSVLATVLAACPSPRPTGTRDAPKDSLPGAQPPLEHSVSSMHDAGTARKVRVVAKHPLGVPLHPEERDNSVSGRLRDGSEVRVVSKSSDGRWLEVVASDGQRGWITIRYAPELAESEVRAAVELAPDSVFHSKQACEKLVASRRAERKPTRARIMSYNVRRFPDGDRASRTDVEWLACVIASSNADLVAVQEFKNRTQSKGALDQLLGRLDALTKGRWLARFDDCPSVMHVGVLYDETRVKALSFDTFASLNPHGEACKDQLRPGFGGYFRFVGGFDAHVISVHLKSMPTRRALDLRRQSLRGLGAAVERARAAHRDDDVILVGDLNSMGCRKCSPPVASSAEIAELDDALAKTDPRLRRVRARPGCTHYFHGEGALLDHFLVTESLAELGADESARVSGYCGELVCNPLGTKQEPMAYRRLSDHCPVVLDFADRDLD